MIAPFTALLNNPTLLALGGAGIIGTALVTLRGIPVKIWNVFVYFFTVELDVNNDDSAFFWVDKFLSEQSNFSKSRKLRLTSKTEWIDNANKIFWNYGPGIGSSLIWINGTPSLVSRSLEMKGMKPFESISIKILGRSQDKIRKLLKPAENLYKIDDRQLIHMYDSMSGYSVVQRKIPRNLDTIVLKEAQKEKLIADIEWFISNFNWYFDRGIPYHRGYLLSGPAGTGKTSVIAALAGHFKKNVAVLNLGSIKGDSDLIDAFTDIPENCILAIEDVDAATHAGDSREGNSDSSSNGITLAGLLNALDGICTPEGLIIFMTTNHPEILDPALIRPGRADVHEVLGLMEEKEQLEMSSRFYDGKGISSSKPISPAELQGILMRHSADREAGLIALQNFKN